MKRSLTSIPQLYRNVRRWAEIVSVLSRYGLADWLSRLNLNLFQEHFRAPDGELIAELSQHARIRCALAELGPTFIKFGQLLSTRPDLIGTDLADELSKLQSDTPADSFEQVQALIESELGMPIDEAFLSIDETPIASASIGQVHRAILHPHMRVVASDSDSNAEAPDEVVIKVQHSGIERKIETDLDILSGLAQLAERIEDFRNYQPSVVVKEMSRVMRRELDFEREKRSLLQFRAMFESDDTIRFPLPVPHLCTSRLLTMSIVDGIKLGDAQDKYRGEEDLSSIAKRGANIYLKMIFQHGFYHADPHPGNILIGSKGEIGLLDFGMVGRISERLREDIEAMLVAIVNQDVVMLSTLIKRVGRCPFDMDESSLSNDVADFVGNYSTQVLAQFDMSGALRDFIGIVRRYKITLPGEVSLLIKVLVTLEGTGRMLDPEFSLMEVMKPIQRMLILKRLSPTRHVRKMRRFYMQVEQLVDSLPTKVASILDQVQSGRFDVHLDHRRLGPSVNRLVLGMLTSSLFLGSALMMSYKVPPLLFPGQGPAGIQDVSTLGLMGLLVSVMTGLRLILAIRKSGNLDQSDERR